MGVALRRMCAIGNVALAFACIGAMNHGWAAAAGMTMKLTASLSGAEQVPAVQTKGTGQFQATVASGKKSISYRLTASGLSSRWTAAHIHVGKKGANGGVVAFLCGGGGKPPCPASGGTVSGRITAANVLATDGVTKGDLSSLIQAITNGDTYVNAHTTKYKDGEIRGQIETSK
jgi:Cu/Zn superoxide dismutase